MGGSSGGMDGATTPACPPARTDVHDVPADERVCPLCGAGYAPFGAEACEQVDRQVHLTRAAPTPPSRPGGGSFTPTPTTTPDSGNAAQADNPRAGPAPIPEPCATGASSTVAELHVVRALAASRPPRLA